MSTGKLYGMAVLITDRNIDSLKILNGGQKVKRSIIRKGDHYFVLFPYSALESCAIMTAYAFFRDYTFVNDPNTQCFVEIDQKYTNPLERN